jgi:biotin operon repressor
MTAKKHTESNVIAAILQDSHALDVKQLNQKYGVKDGTIRAILRRNKISPAKPDPARLLIPKEKLESLLTNGWVSSNELAKICNCSYAKVKRSLKTHGILVGRKPNTRSRVLEGTRSFKVLAQILATPDLELEAIGKMLNCTREYVSQVEAMARKEGIIK